MENCLFCKIIKGEMPAGIDGSFNLSDVRDLANGTILAAEKGRDGECYILANAEITFKEFCKIIVAESLDAAIEIANELAPEHLELCVDNPFDWLDKVRHAGSIFMGRNCPEALGDYFAGPNHTLPTSGTAKFSSPLSVDDFIKKSQYTYYPREALGKVAADVAYFARQEGLEAHARSALIRTEE